MHVSVNLLAGVWPPSCTTLSSLSCRAYVPMSNTASHDNHEKINTWVLFSFLHGYGTLLDGPSDTGARLLT